jgi:2-haloacid dehalogenase
MPGPQVILFDVNGTLLDLQPMREKVGSLLGDPEAARLWFTTLLHHSLVTTVADRFADFAAIGAACLRMVARNHAIELSEAEAREAVAPMRSLPPFPDAIPALKQLRLAKYRLATLTNSSKSALAEQVSNAGLTHFFEALLSVEDVGMYKPHGHVYRWAAHRLGVPVSDCLLVAAHGWDVAGAAWAGMTSAFVARPGQQLFPLGPTPHITVASLEELPGRIDQL